MAVPKRRVSSRRRGNRQAHNAIGIPNLRPCPECSVLTRPHRVCSECGYYKGEQVVLKVQRASEIEKTK